MREKKNLRSVLICAAMVLCAVLCAGCSGKPKINDYYSSAQLLGASADIAINGYKYTMYGPYFVYFQGAYYLVEFDGDLNWVDTPPEELFFVELDEFYSDKKLNKRCCYSGTYVEERFLLGDKTHFGYQLDGSRPKIGSVLYLDESKVRMFYLPGSDQAYGPDDILKANGPIVYEGIVLADENGIFREELNTPRKIYRFFTDRVFMERLSYADIKYPSIFSVIETSERQENGKCFVRCGKVTIGTEAPSFRPMNRIRLIYSNSDFSTREIYVYENEAAAAEFLTAVQEGRYTVLETDEKNRPIKVDGWEICYSREDFNRLLEEEEILDTSKGMQVAYYSVNEWNADPEYKFDGNLHYLTDTEYIRLYAIWEPAKTVTLRDMEQETLVCVGKKKDVVLPKGQEQPGCEFVSWHTDEACTSQPVTKISHTDTFDNLYAKYREVDFYTLSFEAYNGQTFADIQYSYGDTVELPSLHKSFYMFKGWCIDAECKTEPITSVSPEFFGSYHLYPCFEPREYTITLMMWETVERIQVRYGENFQLPVSEESKGNGFIGYFDENGLQYTDENGKSLAPFTDGADIQLFAKYKEE